MHSLVYLIPLFVGMKISIDISKFLYMYLIALERHTGCPPSKRQIGGWGEDRGKLVIVYPFHAFFHAHEFKR